MTNGITFSMIAPLLRPITDDGLASAIAWWTASPHWVGRVVDREDMLALLAELQRLRAEVAVPQ